MTINVERLSYVVSTCVLLQPSDFDVVSYRTEHHLTDDRSHCLLTACEVLSERSLADVRDTRCQALSDATSTGQRHAHQRTADDKLPESFMIAAIVLDLAARKSRCGIALQIPRTPAFAGEVTVSYQSTCRCPHQ